MVTVTENLDFEALQYQRFQRATSAICNNAAHNDWQPVAMFFQSRHEIEENNFGLVFNAFVYESWFGASTNPSVMPMTT